MSGITAPWKRSVAQTDPAASKLDDPQVMRTYLNLARISRSQETNYFRGLSPDLNLQSSRPREMRRLARAGAYIWACGT